ncbi:phosphomannomutase/phosphoglucomutase [Patescibacteria group bacterium]|nr:phosphomannomutase/phosphoglucomutase [Patescibacteria group bacterium]MBU1895317.1 phosphomannomutase/phosphoglucomutase [Patescibacteria group bacterium]
MIFPEHIFKAYDIRGLIEGELSPEIAYRLGRAFVVFMKKNGFGLSGDKFVVGRDMRESSFGFSEEVMRGIEDEGGTVVDIGLVSTPVFNFACAHFEDHTAGIMVTASHNPAEYNGFKMTMGDGLPIGGQTGMQEIKKMVQVEDFGTVDKVREKGNRLKKEILPVYIDHIFGLIKKENIKPMKIVVDGGNGMGGEILPHVLKVLPQIDVEYLYIEPDGNFPNHEANPLKIETLKDLQAKVNETNANFGFAMDGDADRIGLVDEKGQVVEASFVGALMGLEVLKKHGRGRMLYDLRSSMIIPEVWKENGGAPDMCMVGHANIKKMMKEKETIFASELSEHFYFGDLYDLESSDLCLLYILEMLSRENKSLSELVQPLKKYFHSGEINFEVEDKDEVIAQLDEKYKAEAEEISHLDGLWMKFGWGWVSVRKSNTEPVLRLNLEVGSEEDMREKVEEISGLIK